jgi:hypothetical protein
MGLAVCAVILAGYAATWTHTILWVPQDGRMKIGVSRGAFFLATGGEFGWLDYPTQWAGISEDAAPGWHIRVSRSSYLPDRLLWEHLRHGPDPPFVWWPSAPFGTRVPADVRVTTPEPTSPRLPPCDEYGRFRRPALPEPERPRVVLTFVPGPQPRLYLLPLWIPLAMVLLLTLLLFRPRLRRFPAGRCQECGYDLRASPERCPECGTLRLHRIVR